MQSVFTSMIPIQTPTLNKKFEVEPDPRPLRSLLYFVADHLPSDRMLYRFFEKYFPTDEEDFVSIMLFEFPKYLKISDSLLAQYNLRAQYIWDSQENPNQGGVLDPTTGVFISLYSFAVREVVSAFELTKEEQQFIHSNEWRSIDFLVDNFFLLAEESAFEEDFKEKPRTSATSCIIT